MNNHGADLVRAGATNSCHIHGNPWPGATQFLTLSAWAFDDCRLLQKLLRKAGPQLEP